MGQIDLKGPLLRKGRGALDGETGHLCDSICAEVQVLCGHGSLFLFFLVTLYVYILCLHNIPIARSVKLIIRKTNSFKDFSTIQLSFYKYNHRIIKRPIIPLDYLKAYII